jgi:nitrogen regulatory protein P-II 1
MKKIEAIIRHHKLDAVKEALMEAGIQGMTVAETRGYGGQHGTPEIYRGAEYAVDFLPRVKVEVLIDDKDCEAAVGVIVKAARTGQVGDGRVMVSKIEEVVRVRTGESGVHAL